MSNDIVYPPGCRPVTDDLGADELVRRLKTLAHTLQSLGQDEGTYQQYIPLALHIVQDCFLQHSSRDVQLLTACCIADVLRVYAPEAPYKDPEQVKTIFMFLIRQLSGLKDPKDPAFKRYFYLLENLAYVKSFNMCFDLDDCQEIICSLFNLIFKIVNDEHSGKVKSFMLDILCPLIIEADVVSNELLDIILMNIVEPNKSQKKNAYTLAKETIVKCSDILEPYIQAFFNHVLLIGSEEKSLNITSKIYELIYELNHICPSVLLAVLPQLEIKLKSTNEADRLSAVGLLARMFSETDSNLARHHQQLWTCFLGRFHDISPPIRIKCIQHSIHFLLNHAELRAEITEALKKRLVDIDEEVRYQVIMAIVQTARRDFQVVCESEDLLHCLKQRAMDKRFKIRKEAISGLAFIYRKQITEQDLPLAIREAAPWIKDKILHGYYMSTIEDRLLVERLLNTCLVPYTLPAPERMKKLCILIGTIDDHAFKAFMELLKHQHSMRTSVGEWLELHRQPPSADRDREIASRTLQISKFLPESHKALEFIRKFSSDLLKDPALFESVRKIVQPGVSCKECANITTNIILKGFSNSGMVNQYYSNVKMLLERISPVLIDSEALKVLIDYVEDFLNGGPLAEELGVNSEATAITALDLLRLLTFVFPAHFIHEDIIRHLFSFISTENKKIIPHFLAMFIYLGRFQPLEKTYPEIMQELIPVCKTFATVGSPKEAKHAIRCLFINIESFPDTLFSEILEHIKENLLISSKHFCTAIVSLGHLSCNLGLPDKYTVQIKNLISGKIVRDFLLKDVVTSVSPEIADRSWCEKKDLPYATLCKVEALKLMARWLLGTKTDLTSARKTFKMITVIITNKGDLLNSGNISTSEMAWMRLAAGCAMLKICEHKGVGDQFNAEQFYILSRLMRDEVPEVRSIFCKKLHAGLGRYLPLKSLPLDFMGYYALAGTETNKALKDATKGYMLIDVNKRRDYIKACANNSTMSSDDRKQLARMIPDYMLVFAVPVLAHDPEFTSIEDLEQLNRIKECLSFVLEPLITKNETYCFGFYKDLIEKMKNHKAAINKKDEMTNKKLWAVCDLAYATLCYKTTNFDLKIYPWETRIPAMHFRKHEDPMFVNEDVYIPVELQYQPPKKAGSTSSSGKDRKKGYRARNTRKAKQESSLKADKETQSTSDAKNHVSEVKSAANNKE